VGDFSVLVDVEAFRRLWNTSIVNPMPDTYEDMVVICVKTLSRYKSKPQAVKTSVADAFTGPENQLEAARSANNVGTSDGVPCSGIANGH
jgi:hypothetical protein